MTRRILALTLSASLVASCGSIGTSVLNPMNWFGGSTSKTVEEGANPLIPRKNALSSRRDEAPYAGQLVGTVSELLIERRPGGAIIRAKGVSDRQGAYAVRLVKDETQDDPSKLVYDLRALQRNGGVGGTASRAVTVAEWLTDQDLAGVRSISVRGASNIRTARR